MIAARAGRSTVCMRHRIRLTGSPAYFQPAYKRRALATGLTRLPGIVPIKFPRQVEGKRRAFREFRPVALPPAQIGHYWSKWYENDYFRVVDNPLVISCVTLRNCPVHLRSQVALDEPAGAPNVALLPFGQEIMGYPRISSCSTAGADGALTKLPTRTASGVVGLTFA
jgi:hypothetical protein